MKLVHLTTVDSTNIYAKKLLAAAQPSDLNGTVVYADSQTAGHGRLGRPFYSPDGTGIYMSIIYVPGSQNVPFAPTTISSPALITASTAVAVCRVLDKAFNVKTQIKWVNDLYLGGKKVCGILTEGHVDSARAAVTAAVVGIGVNVSTQNFPQEISNKAGGILNGPLQFDRENLITQIANDCLEIFDSPEKTKQAFKEYRERSMLIGRQITVHPVIDCAEKDYQAKVTGITDEAKLQIQTADGTIQTLDSGEVSLIL